MRIFCLFFFFHLTQHAHALSSALLLVHAGNGTCVLDSRKNQDESETQFRQRRLTEFAEKMPMYNQFKSARKLLSGLPKSDLKWIVSCFGMFKPLYYVTSEDPETLRETHWSEFNAVVDALNLDRGPVNAYIIGHSYGGSLALRAADLLATNDAASVNLFTLDAINFDCTLDFNFKTIHKDCARFPLYPDPSLLRSKMSGVWHNYYQTSANISIPVLGKRPLHSGAVPTKIDVDEKENDGNGDVYDHIRLQSSEKAWKAFFAKIQQDYPAVD